MSKIGPNTPIHWGLEAIWEQISPILPHFTLELLPEIDSTNTELMRRAKAGQTQPILLVAEKQTAGRGRLGREWHTLPSNAAETTNQLPALTFSLGMPLSPKDWAGLSLAVGVCLAENLHPAIGLKWPNDLWLKAHDAADGSERKLAGILIETATFHGQRYVVIGVGINISEPSAKSSLAQNLRTQAVGLQTLLPAATAANTLQRLVLPLVQTILAFESHGFAPFQARFNALDVLRDRYVFLHNRHENGAMLHSDSPHSCGGIAQGVENNGALLLNTEHGIQTIHSSEVSVRPV